MKTIVIYYSAQNHTKKIAEKIAANLGADIFEITPKVPYKEADLDWMNEDSRSSREFHDMSLRDVELASSDVPNWSEYDAVVLLYPIWWGIMPMIVYSFFDDYDMSSKTIMPFTTSGGSGAGDTQSRIQELEPNAKVFDVLHFYASEMANDQTESVKAWIDKNK